MAESADTQPRRTVSEVRRSRWPGWIWGVPVAAIGIVVWLLIRAFSDRGIDATVVFEDAAGMKEGDTEVMFRGMKVGTVRRLTLDPDGVHVIAELNIDHRVQQYLRSDSEFYLKGAQPSFSDPASLKSIVAGPSIVLVSGQGKPARHFNGRLGSPPERLTVSVPYVLHFSTSGGELKPGAPVKLLGFTVGEVANVQLTTDPVDGKVSTAVLVMLDPTRFHIQGAPEQQDSGTHMNTALGHLVQHGLRARLTQAPPVVGSGEITLAMEPEAAPGRLQATGPHPEIPVQEGGGLDRLFAQAGQLPLAEIGENIRATTAQLKTLTSSPQLEHSIDRLDSALAALDKMVHDSAPQVAPTLQSVHQTVEDLRKTASEIDATAVAARRTVSAGPTSANGNLQDSLRELTDAARAVRSLANDLDQHPESLVRGR
ncbi:MAG: MCE family protein [Proteobacteria bacterium]|nr:MCE family protein [Pseudomonadota bacterium]